MCWRTTIHTATLLCTMRWCVWRRISACVIRWSTARGTSGTSTATKRLLSVTPRRAWRSWRRRCCAILKKRLSTICRLTTNRRKNRSCCRRVFQTCSSTAPRGSLSGWRRTCRRTICAKSPMGSSPSSTILRSAMKSSATSSKRRISQLAASSWGLAVCAMPT